MGRIHDLATALADHTVGAGRTLVVGLVPVWTHPRNPGPSCDSWTRTMDRLSSARFSDPVRIDADSGRGTG